MKNKYRIIFRVDHYEVQVKKWWFPFWVQADFINVNFSIDEAEQYIERHKKYGNGNVVIDQL